MDATPTKWLTTTSILMLLLVLAAASEDETSSSKPPLAVKVVKGKKLCDKGWECKGLSAYCCNQTISDFFQTYQFENLFSKRNTPVAHAAGFWDYHSFITAAAVYQPVGFGTSGGKNMGQKELAAFLGHVGSKTSCGYGVATGGPLAWGLCYNKELSPDQLYCDDYYKYDYPCTPGASYHGRGALPLYWNYNYGKTGEALKVDLLNHPEYIENNATLAFQAAIWKWMTPDKKNKIPSAHDVFVGNWKPTKNDTLAKRVPGFGATMNVLHGEQMCGKGDDDAMNNVVSHYLYYLDLMGVGREEAGPHEVLTCGEQLPFGKAPTATSSS
ncbi:Chitinase-like protein 2 [Linum grandiflorum]